MNNTLLKEYGLPVWASYAIFAIATILLGALVGLFLVCIIDFIWPQKHVQRQTFSEQKEKDKFNDNEDIKGDELLDDEEEDETSESEKISGSDSDEIESDKDKGDKASPKATPTSSPDVRKRRTRKAD